ncbi:Serine/threonine-protein kinase 32B [Acromyrmex echinatior]|uniref:Serine/threonine-protein kinase 32B n=1 Tax=Acromyrmex echinatior TaxID=103372 RepID=F4WP29_ACREC|nr:Serine/threonine-protein kinase 32B [Acromyrmex echinatior]
MRLPEPTGSHRRLRRQYACTDATYNGRRRIRPTSIEKKWVPINRPGARPPPEKKVCIVQKRDSTGNMYAMKYVHKNECAERGALKNVAREVEILSKLEHPCLVNLWFSFQGHAHVTDFNIATVLENGQLATSMSGTKPYIAPEIYMCSCEEYGVLGYGFAVDWWSLGILAWETLAMERPYPLHSTTSNREALRILKEERPIFSHWSPSIRDLLDRLLTLAPSARVSCLKELKQAKAMRDLDFDKVLKKQIKPRFTPPKDHLNCDPTFELEEMIIETKPLHKKKKRLAKQRSLRVEHSAEDAGGFAEGAGSSVDTRRLAYIPEYRVYNREREIERQEREKKEKQWEEELNTAMKGAEERLKTKQQHLPAQRTGNRLSVSTTSVKARISASPRQGRRASAATSSDIDFIDASPEPSTS